MPMKNYRTRTTVAAAKNALTGLAVPLLLLTGCAAADQRFGNNELYQKARQGSTKAVDFTKATASKSYSRMQKYMAEKDVLKTFHDTSEHSEAAVLGVLHRSGIGKAPGPTRGGTPAAPSSPPPRAAGAKAPGGAAPRRPAAAPSLNTVPEQYAGAYRWPLDAGIISSEYGARWGKMHKGLDIAADSGEPVYAVASGEVIYAGDGLRGYGNVVILRHDRKISSLYAHNSELKVKQGDEVKQGELIALLGSTGHSTGPHVHFELRDGDVAVNPHTLLPKAKVADEVATRESGPAPVGRGTATSMASIK